MAANGNEVSYDLSSQYLLPDFPSKYCSEMIAKMKSSEVFLYACVEIIFGSGRYKGKTILEVGCGPTVHRLATPSKYYDEIITSDYSSDNIASVKKWLKGDADALDWTPFLEIAAEAEQPSDVRSGLKAIEARIRQKVKSVLHCDVLKQPIFDSEIDKVDLVITAFCLEGACPSLENFAASLTNLGKYVKTGGHLLIFTVLGMSSVEFDGGDFKGLGVHEDFVAKAVREAGFAFEYKFFKANDIPDIEFVGTFLAMARKL